MSARLRASSAIFLLLVGCTSRSVTPETPVSAAGNEALAHEAPSEPAPAFTRVLVDSFVPGHRETPTRIVWLLDDQGRVSLWRSTALTRLTPLESEATYTDLALATADQRSNVCGLRDDGGVDCWPLPGDVAPVEVLGAGTIVRFRWGRQTGCVVREQTLECWYGLAPGADVVGEDFSLGFAVEVTREVACYSGWGDGGARTRCVSLRDRSQLVDRLGECAVSGLRARMTPATLDVECHRVHVVVRSLMSGPEVSERIDDGPAWMVDDLIAGCIAAGSTAVCESTNRLVRPVETCEHGYLEHVSGLGRGCARDSRGLFDLGERIVDLDDDGEAACAVLVSGAVSCWGGGGDVSSGREVGEQGLRWATSDDCRAERQCWSVLSEISSRPFVAVPRG